MPGPDQHENIRQHEAAESESPRVMGDRLLSVTQTIERELESLRKLGGEQDEREKALQSKAREVMEAEARARELVEQGNRDREESARRGEELSRREREVSERFENLERRESQAEGQARTLQEKAQSLESLELTLREKQAQFDAASSELEAEKADVTSAAERVGTQKKILRDREQTVGERERTCDAREAELGSQQASVSSSAEAARRIAELEDTAQGIEAEYKQRIEALEAQLKESQEAALRAAERASSVEQSAEGAAELEAEIARRDDALEILQTRLREAVARGGELEQKLAQTIEELEEAQTAPAQSDPSSNDDGSNAMRRDRLRRLKKLLEERARKVIRAREALTKRAAELDAAQASMPEPEIDHRAAQELAHKRAELEERLAEAEKMLAQRSALAEREEALQIRVRALKSKSTKGSAGVVTASLSVMLAASAIGGWALAGVFAEGEYLARATIAMEETGDDPSAEAIGSWMDYHQTLARDPQMIEKTSERMRKRGYAALGTAVALTARLQKDLEVQVGAPGELSLILRGTGLSRTENELDIVAGSLAQMGNDARDRRLDRTAAVIKAGAKADGRPINDPRMPLFGAIAGGLAMLSMGAWLVAWRGMAKRSSMAPMAVADDGPM